VIARLSRHGLAVALLLVGLAPARGQNDLELIKKPQNVPEFWRALQFQIAVGKYDLAAEHLRGLLAANPTDKDLLAIEEKEGMAPFLALRNVQKWSDNPKLQAEARQNVEKLISMVTEAIKKFRNDPDRIQRFIRNLTAGPEEREFAILELKKSGTAIMPPLMGAIVSGDLQERAQLLGVLPLLDADTVPAVLACFDVTNAPLRLDLMGVLQQRPDLLKLTGRSETDPRPTLWHLSTSTDLVGQKAREFLQALMGFRPDKMPAPAGELIKAAEVMYQRKATFSKDADPPPVWRWDGKKLVSMKLSTTQAEEYYGLRYARWALDIDPDNEAAQVIFLSIATERAFERVGVDKQLAEAAPDVHQLLALAPASVLYKMLNRSLADNHLSTALGATQVIGERAEVKGYRTTSAPAGRNIDGARALPDPLVHALNGQDRRLSLAAADALTRTPGAASAPVASRVVEVYRSALAGAKGAAEGAELHPKALVADADAVRADLLAGTLRAAGFDTVVTQTGRDTLKRLNQASDIDVLWIDSELPYPELPYLLAQIRTDVKYGRLPLFITLATEDNKAVLPELAIRVEHLLKAIPQAKVVDRSLIRIEVDYDALTIDQAALDDWLRSLRREQPTVLVTIQATMNIRVQLDKSRESDAEMQQKIRDLTSVLPEIRVIQDAPTRYTLSMDGTRPVPEALENRLSRLKRDYPQTVIARELATRMILSSKLEATIPPDLVARVNRLVEPYRNVRVVRRPVTVDALREEMSAFAAEPMTRPLSEAERKDHQKRAIEGLRRLAIGITPGYDVRPAANEILNALRSDDLAPAAIDAAGRLPGKEPQQRLADLVLDTARPAALRAKAAQELARHIGIHTAAPLVDTQIKGLTSTLENEKSPEVKAAIAVVIGTLPQERVLRNLSDDMAREAWRNRLQRFEPRLSVPGAAPPPAPKDEGK
jgi:CheY-like chemotaxis protein